VFEHGPFRTCPSCQAVESFGILSVGGSSLNRRCKRCRFRCSEELPGVDKKVVYLDQLAVSEIFKTKSKTRRHGANNEAFWKDVEREANLAYLLQQVIFPASSIHRDETTVSPFASELSLAHEMMSGDTSFQNIDEINMTQVLEFAQAYLEKRSPPTIAFNVDDILEGERNDWLPNMHITVNMDLSAFADQIRANRDATAAAFVPLMQSWIAEKPTFTAVLATELKSFGSANRSALLYAAEKATKAIENMERLDALEFFDGLSHPVMNQFKELKTYFERHGVHPNNSAAEVHKYWDWPANEHIPTHRNSAYLFAALARKLISGQKRLPSRGMFNDINAISTYGPYVDAMFLDNECAQLLSEQPLATDLKLKAKIFSTNSGDAFLDYLRELQNGASAEARAYAIEIYGL
jgi:hypothetical protein